MANLTETASWEATVNEIATTDPVVGGVGGPANVQATQLANRTAFLKGQVDGLVAAETVAVHEAKADPHPQYLTPAEGDAAYDALGSVSLHVAKADPHPQYLKEADAPSQAEAEAGLVTTVRAWSALRVKQAIQALVKSATESVAGIAEISTQAETNAGLDDLRFITPKKLRFGFSVLLAANGYIVFPTWLSGFTFQWVKGPLSGAESTNYPAVNLPIAFNSNCLFAGVFTQGNGTIVSDQVFQITSWTANSVTVFPQWFGTGGQSLVYPLIFAIGH